MKKLKPLVYIFYSAIILGGILLDQLSKLLVVKLLKPVFSVPLWKDVLHFTYVENDGAAFGMLDNHRWVFMVISTVAIIGLSVYLYLGRCENHLYEVGVAMIISGGIGNMIDRLAYGYVVDFIDFCLIDFAVFNIADCFVCIGAGLLILALVLEIIKESRKIAEDKKDGGDRK